MATKTGLIRTVPWTSPYPVLVSFTGPVGCKVVLHLLAAATKSEAEPVPGGIVEASVGRGEQCRDGRQVTAAAAPGMSSAFSITANGALRPPSSRRPGQRSGCAAARVGSFSARCRRVPLT